ncbi:universal stress protein [Ideonella sp. A 288]|uniref:universal stress protein n=1 Tax=Ideonella sp. A 288 TaxID=1962181 RepID=UPI000B4C1DF5|nr:universal stress protein [Ideonella sp. A 288]
MKNALIPIDGSPAALRALALALDTVRGQAEGQVHVLNVQAPMLHPWPGKLVSPDMIAAELHSQGEKLLAQPGSMALAEGIACVPAVRIGAAAEEIAAYAAEQGCDAIVMGTRGMGAVAGLVMGSVAQKVVHLASVPVTLVK